MAWRVECLLNPLGDWGVQSQVKSYQRLKTWYLIPPCLTLSIIMYRSRVKWSHPGKGEGHSPTSWSSSYCKGSLQVALYYGCQLYLLTMAHSICMGNFLKKANYMFFFRIFFHKCRLCIVWSWFIIKIILIFQNDLIWGYSKWQQIKQSATGLNRCWLVVLYGISTFDGYSKPKPVHTNILRYTWFVNKLFVDNIFDEPDIICWHIVKWFQVL